MPGQDSWIRVLDTACLAVATWFAGALWAAAPAAASSGAEKPAEQGAEEPAEVEIPVRTDVLNLGQFRVRGCRNTDKEIIDIQFGLWLVLSTGTTEADFHELESWKNRLRDQAIIAVRSAAPEDFAEPELRRLNRMIMFRIKRLPIGSQIIGAYLIDFTLEEGETAEDYFRPAIIPSAPAKKPSGGGH
jgi:hypothetical protein